MRKPEFVAILIFAGLIPLAAICSAQNANSAPVPVVQDWQKQFDDICSKTQDAMTYSVEELQAFILKCDALRPQIDKLDETPRKVYSRKLGQCRGLFAYVLESKQLESKSKDRK